MTALEYVMPQGEFCKYDYEEYCWIEEACLEAFKNVNHRNSLLFHSRCDLFEKFTTNLCGSYLMDKETRDRLNALEIRFDKETMDWESFVRRPYYRIRGKKITEEQAAEIIENIWNPCYDDYDDENKIALINMNNPVKPDGTAGENRTTSKWPDINEMIQDALQLKLRFPYLDFIMAISWWNELPNEAWENDLFESEFINGRLYEYEHFSENLEIGIWVHDSKIEILDKSSAEKKYNEYDRLYSDKDLRKYILDWGNFNNKDIDG